MDFTKYSSIDNSYRHKLIDYIIRHGYSSSKITYCCTTKADGSNFSFWYDGTEMSCAKRTSFLGDGDNFFSWEGIYDMYAENVKKVWDILNSQEYSMIENIVVYGELIGGKYNHPDVDKLPYPAIQKRVNYCPHNDFIVFDIKVNGDYIPFKDMEELCYEAGLWVVPIMKMGTFEECLNVNVDTMEDPIYRLWKLPKIENNYTEGVVIRPFKKELRLNNGDRVILKKNSTAFAEKMKVSNKDKVKIEQVKLSDEEKDLVFVGMEYVTKSRLYSVVSKIGQVTDKMFGKVQGLFLKDVLEDMQKENEKLLTMCKKSRKLIQKEIGKYCAEVLRKEFVNIIDGYMVEE